MAFLGSSGYGLQVAHLQCHINHRTPPQCVSSYHCQPDAMHVDQHMCNAAGNSSCSLHSSARPSPCAFGQVHRHSLGRSLLRRPLTTFISRTAQTIPYHKKVTNSGRPQLQVDSSASEEQNLQSSGSQVTQSSTVSPSTGSPRPRADVKLNLFSVLLESAALQAFTQIQSSIDQVQQTATKLTKGLRQRPPGYPPGTTAAMHASFHASFHVSTAARHDAFVLSVESKIKLCAIFRSFRRFSCKYAAGSSRLSAECHIHVSTSRWAHHGW